MIAIALLGVVGAAGFAVAMRRTRAEQQDVYRRDREWLRKRAGATRPPRRDRGDAAPAVASRTHCVMGVDTFATAVARAVVDVPRGDRRKRLAAMLRASELAVTAERTAELERPAPTLPQRMGSTAADDGARLPIDPPRAACDGKGFAEIWTEAPASSTSSAAGGTTQKPATTKAGDPKTTKTDPKTTKTDPKTTKTDPKTTKTDPKTRRKTAPKAQP
jgi:hypothetical protein